MGSSINKAFKKATRFLDKKIVEPLIEKPVKKIGKETFDVVFNTTDEERRAMLGGTPPPAPEAEGQQLLVAGSWVMRLQQAALAVLVRLHYWGKQWIT